jgi:hypothetical protein
MTLYEKIISIYPELIASDFRQDAFLNGIITLQNDGDGDYIAKWEHPTLAKPTDEELA